MMIIKELNNIVEMNIERDKILSKIAKLKVCSLKNCNINEAYFVDNCIEKDNALYHENGNKLGVKMRNVYYILENKHRPFGIMYFSTEIKGRFIGVPFMKT